MFFGLSVTTNGINDRVRLNWLLTRTAHDDKGGRYIDGACTPKFNPKELQ